MRVILSMIVIFFFTFAASGANKIIDTYQFNTHISQSIVSLTNDDVLEREQECCHKTETENESQTQRCIGDNLVIATQAPDVEERYAEVLHCTTTNEHEFVVHERDIRPPIA